MPEYCEFASQMVVKIKKKRHLWDPVLSIILYAIKG